MTTTAQYYTPPWYQRQGRGRGYLTALLGTVGGAVVLGGLGALPAALPCEGEGYSCLGPAYFAFFMAPLGLLVGSVLGCYLALRLRRYPWAGLTAWFMIGFLLVAAVLSGAIDANVGGGSSQVWVPASSAMFLAPLVARWIAAGKFEG